MAAEESPLPCLCLSQTPTGRILPEPICQTHLFLPLKLCDCCFVLTFAFWKAGGAQFHQSGDGPNNKLCFSPTEAYYDSKNVHTNQ